MTYHLTDRRLQGTALQWLSSYFCGWGQRMAPGGRTSLHYSLKRGVPQGAIFSPMSFNIYMFILTQLAWSLGLGCHQYANTQLCLLMDSHLDSAPVDLNRVLGAEAGWLRQSWLKLNSVKTEVLSLRFIPFLNA